MAIGARILGLAKLEQKFKRLPKVARDMVRGAMEQGADDIVDMMKRRVAEDDGALRKASAGLGVKLQRAAWLSRQSKPASPLIGRSRSMLATKKLTTRDGLSSVQQALPIKAYFPVQRIPVKENSHSST